MATVQIACKLPLGLLLEIIEPGLRDFPLPPGKVVRLKGANSQLTDKTVPIIGAFGITEVDEEFWNAWYARNKDLKFVREGMVFMQKNVSGARDQAKEHAQILTGMEPLNPKGDKRLAGVQPDLDAMPQLKKAGII